LNRELIEHSLDKSEMATNIRTLRMAGFKFDRHAMNLSISHITCLFHYYDGDKCIATLMLFTGLLKMCWYRQYLDLPKPAELSQ